MEVEGKVIPSDTAQTDAAAAIEQTEEKMTVPRPKNRWLPSVEEELAFRHGDPHHTGRPFVGLPDQGGS